MGLVAGLVVGYEWTAEVAVSWGLEGEPNDGLGYQEPGGISWLVLLHQKVGVS